MSNLILNSNNNNKISLISGVSGLLKFNGVDSFVNLTALPAVEGHRTLEFNVYWDSSVYIDSSIIVTSYEQCLILFCESYGSKTEITIMPRDDTFKVYTKLDTGAGGTNTYKISHFPVNPWNNILHFVVDISNYLINYVTVNGQILTLDSSTGTSSYIQNKYRIGAGFDMNTAYYGYIWDIKQYENGTLTHYWPGKNINLSNVNAAWEDLIGTNDGSIVGSIQIKNIGNPSKFLFSGKI